MHILYVSQYFPPEIGAPAARVSELARHWVQAGHRVTVLTAFPNHPTGEIHPDYRRRFRRLITRENHDGIDVVRTWLIPLPNRKPHERILNYSSFCLSSFLRGLFLARPDVIIATSPQLLVGLAGWMLARVKRVPVILEIRDIWPDAIIASGVGHEDSLLSRALSALSRFLYERCDHVVVVTPAFREELIERWDVPAEKISIVQNGVETELFTPDEKGEEKTRSALEGRFAVAYVGTIGLAHGLDTILDAAPMLQTRHPEVLFLIVGEGADKDHLVSRVRAEELGNVRFIPQRPRSEIPAIVRSCDACLVLLKKADVFKTVIPTKMLEFMASGRPVILGVDGQARRLMEEADAGLFIEPEDPVALTQAIARLLGDDELRHRMGRNGRKYIEERLSRGQTAVAYLKLLGQMSAR